jgi:hypothetical protein
MLFGTPVIRMRRRIGPCGRSIKAVNRQDRRMSDSWALLGLERGATYREARAAWLRRAQLLHPDKHVGAEPSLLAEANRALAQLNAAWDDIRSTYSTEDRATRAPTSQPTNDRSNAEPAGSGPRSQGDSDKASDLVDELEFLIDAVEQGAVALRDHFSSSELMQLRQRFSLITNGALMYRAEASLLFAMKLDALDDLVAHVGDSLALPRSWFETYEAFADVDDPPYAFVLAEHAARTLAAEYPA